MKNLVLAGAAVLALGTGTAFADGIATKQPAQATQSARSTQQNTGILASQTSSSVWVYPLFRNGDAQGGNG